MDDQWSRGYDLESLDDSICAIVLNNSGGYGGVRILGHNILQELQAPTFWVAGGQKYLLVVRKTGEICETYGSPRMLVFWRKRKESAEEKDVKVGYEKLEGEAVTGLGISMGED